MADYPNPFVGPIADPPFEWGENKYPGTGGEDTKDVVIAKYDATMSDAQSFLNLLIGEDGVSGYLGAMNDIIRTYTAPEIDDFTVTIPTIGILPDERPVPKISDLDTDFPTFDKASPTLPTLPSVDLSGLNSAEMPEAIAAAVNWVEQNHDNQLFTDLLSRMLADLQSGATGLDADVEQDIYDRAQARQEAEEDRIQTDFEEYFSTSGFDLPPLAKAALLQEHANGRTMRSRDLSKKMRIDQAQLAQTNSQFIIKASTDMEAVLRNATDKKNDRALDYAKAVAANAISVYAENVRAYIAALEGDKAYVEVQVEHLKAVVESNKGLVASYAAEAEAYNTQIEAKAKKNEAITEIYKAEVVGYDAETRAVMAAQQMTVEEYKLKLQNADLELRKAIAEIQAYLQGYTTESSLREKVAEAMANIAMQALASSYGSTHMAASISHKTGRSQREDYDHNETRRVGYSKDNNLREGHTFTHDTDK